MDIWKILNISPTTDKKAIKKAYAEKTKEIHPEEKPDEFKQLHGAYQSALHYAALMSKGNSLPDSGTEMTAAGESDAENTVDNDADNKELIAFFEDNQEKHQQLVDEFMEYWKAYKSAWMNPEILVRWKAYLSSESFQEIRYYPQVLHLLAEELGQKNEYVTDELKLLFWDAYGFQGDEGAMCQGDRQRLWSCLNPARIRARKKKRKERITRDAATIATLFFCIYGAYITGKGEWTLFIFVSLLFFTKQMLKDIRD